MNRQPLLSVLMCVYNELPQHLEEAIDSILSQTYTHFEFIIIHDNPEEQLLDGMIHKKAATDSRIRYYRNPENIGLTRSLNFGLSKASGEFIARIDADDISLPDRFAEQIAFLQANHDIAVVGSWAYIINSDGKNIGKLTRAREPETLNSLLFFESPLFHPSVMMRKHISDKPVVYDSNYRYSQDYELWTRLSDSCRFSNIPRFLICYRYSDDQISSHHLEEQQKIAFSIQVRQLEKYKIFLTDTEKKMFRLLTRKVQNPELFSPVEIKKFLCHLIAGLKMNDKINTGIITGHLIHLYATYLTRHYYLWRAFYELLKFQLSVGKIHPYATASLIKNNKLWHVCSNE